MTGLTKEKQKTIKDTILQYPTKSDRDIAKMLGISHPTVSKFRNENMVKIDSDFIDAVAGKFIQEFGAASDHWKKLIEEIEVLKTGKKTVIKQNPEGGYFQTKVDLEPLDKLPMIKEQADLRAKILFLAAQGEVREVIRILRKRELPIAN